MPWWEYAVVGLLVGAALAYLTWYYAGPRRRTRHTECSGDCLQCAFYKDENGCVDPNLRGKMAPDDRSSRPSSS